MKKSKHIYIIAGPNGSGKTTFAREFLPLYAKCETFINADLIAWGLSPFSPTAAALRAGRLLLEQIDRYAARGIDFSFETTLSGVTYLSRFRKLKKRGYSIHLFFLWIPEVKLSLARVASRVKMGGHDIPDKDVRRRFTRGLQNFFRHYPTVLDSWFLFDNSGKTPVEIANQEEGKLNISDLVLYAKILKIAGAK